METNGSVRQNEEALFANLGSIASSKKISQAETSGTISLRSVRLAAGVFQLYLAGGNGRAIFIDHQAGAIRRICRPNLCASKNVECQENSAEHYLSSLRPTPE